MYTAFDKNKEAYPLVVVVIVIWNGIEDTLECLRSLAADFYPNKQILIVDNASTDGSAERILAEHGGVHLLRCVENLGFTGGNNLGMFWAQDLGAKYAFLLNNDTTLEPDAISRLVQQAELSNDAGLVAPLMHYYDTPEEVWFACASLSLWRAEAVHTFPPAQRSVNRRADGRSAASAESSDWSSGGYESPWVSGCAMLARMSAVGQVGGFDERYHLTWEDVDWCVRMRKMGWRVLVAPEARIFHKGGRSGARLSGIHRYYAVRNSLLLTHKHAGARYIWALGCVLGRHLRGALTMEVGQRVASLSTVIEGLWHHWRGRYGRRGSNEVPLQVREHAERKATVEVESPCV